jgi:hypothetical protein
VARQIGRQFRVPRDAALRRSKLDRQILSFDESELAQLVDESDIVGFGAKGRRGQPANAMHTALRA